MPRFLEGLARDSLRADKQRGCIRDFEFHPRSERPIPDKNIDRSAVLGEGVAALHFKI